MPKTRLYSFDDHPDHKQQLAPWADRWLKNALSTKPMDEEERAICRKAVRGLYRAANLVPPPRNCIIFVPSPFILSLASGFMEATWAKSRATANVATTIHAASRNVTFVATSRAIDRPTYDATYAAIATATGAINTAINTATRVALDTALTSITRLDLLQRVRALYQGGNQWNAMDACLTFFRHVAKLPLNYSRYDHWEQLALHGGPRLTHEKFCIISDRPSILKLDAQHRPHCKNGPFCQWRDGSAIYAWHGTYVSNDWIIDKATLTPQIARQERGIGLGINSIY